MSESVENGMDTIPQLGKYQWGEYTFDLDEYPMVTIREAAIRAIKHVISSEVSSSIGSKLGIVKGVEPTEEVKAERRRLEAEARAKHFESFRDGSWATENKRGGPRGPRMDDSYESFLEKEIIKAVRAEFSGRGVKLDKDLNAYSWTDSAGNPQVRTLAEAVANYKANPRRAEALRGLEAIALATFNAKQRAKPTVTADLDL
jgi:hypothetical protein